MFVKNVVAGLLMASAAIGLAGCGSESALSPTELMAKVGCTEPVAEDLVSGAGTTAQYRCSGRDGGSAGNGLVQSMVFFFSSEGSRQTFIADEKQGTGSGIISAEGWVMITNVRSQVAAAIDAGGTMERVSDMLVE